MPPPDDLITAFLAEQEIARDPRPSTLATRRRYLRVFLRMLPRPIEECTTDDLRRTIAHYRKTHAPGTTRMMIMYVIMLCKYLKLELNYAELETMKPKVTSNKKASDMLTKEEVTRLIQAGSNFRDRALVSVLYDGGLRPIECACMKWEDLKFDDYGAVLNTSEKTGKPRYIRLTLSVPALKELRTYADKTGAVFKAFNHGRPPGKWSHAPGETPGLSPHRINDLIQELATIAGITKRVHAHLLRHSRATHLLEDGVSESVIKMIFWGSIDTPMLATYAHVSNRHIDDEMLGNAGIKKSSIEVKKSSLKPVQCPECHTINLPGSRICSTCGIGFTDEARIEYKMAKRILLDPASLRDYADYLEKKKNAG